MAFELTVKDLIYAESLNIKVSIDFEHLFESIIMLEKRYSSQNGFVQWRRIKTYTSTTITRCGFTLRDILDEFNTECNVALERYLSEEVYRYEQNTVSGTGSVGSSDKAP